MQEQARRRRRRGWLVGAVGVLLLLSLVLPHVAVTNGPGYGRSLLLSSFYFLHVRSGTFSGAVNQPQLAVGFNVTYLGLGMHQLGLLLGAATFWSLYPDEVNRWLYRMLVIAGWLLTLSAPTVVLGRVLIDGAGVPASLGLAWLPLMISGVTITVAARRARSRIDQTWYLAKPELM